jgi:hypothetical protein
MTPSRASRFSAVVLAWVANSLVGAAIGTAWLSGLPVGATARSTVFVAAALVSNTAMLALLPAILVLVLARALPAGRVLAIVQAFPGPSSAVALFADTHLASLPLPLQQRGVAMTTPGSRTRRGRTRDWVRSLVDPLLAAMAFAWRRC